MVVKLLVAFALMAVCVMLHAVGLTTAIRWLERRLATRARSPARQIRLLVALAAWMVLVHLVEIAVWAACFVVQEAMPDLDTALYFSAVTYTTTGYGDLVLPAGWRLAGGVEALTGILMCGWSTAFFFAIVSRVFAKEGQR